MCYSDNTEKPKEYLFTWKPFVKEEKKDMTKIDIIKTPITKLYAFDRILFANPPKEKVAVYNAFGKSEHKTQVVINCHNMKKLGDINIEGYCDNFELAPNDRLYAVREDRTEIYGVQAGKLAKLLEVKLNLVSLHSIGKNLLAVNSTGDRILYDGQFDLLMKSPEEITEPIVQILPAHGSRFLVLYGSQRLELWDEAKEEISAQKLDMEVIDITTTSEGTLFVTQSNRIEVLDVHSVLG